MSKKVLLFTAVVFSALVLAACDEFDQAKTQFSNKITGISENGENPPKTTPIVQKAEPTLTDTQIETELNSGAAVDVDVSDDFSNLEKELGQL